MHHTNILFVIVGLQETYIFALASLFIAEFLEQLGSLCDLSLASHDLTCGGATRITTSYKLAHIMPARRCHLKRASIVLSLSSPRSAKENLKTLVILNVCCPPLGFVSRFRRICLGRLGIGLRSRPSKLRC